ERRHGRQSEIDQAVFARAGRSTAGRRNHGGGAVSLGAAARYRGGLGRLRGRSRDSARRCAQALRSGRMKVFWLAWALVRLDEILAYIAKDNPDAAMQVVAQIVSRAEQISAFPQSGRRVADFERDDVRELIEGQYRIVYRVGVRRIDVLTVKHCAQRLPSS